MVLFGAFWMSYSEILPIIKKQLDSNDLTAFFFGVFFLFLFFINKKYEVSLALHYKYFFTRKNVEKAMALIHVKTNKSFFNQIYISTTNKFLQEKTWKILHKKTWIRNVLIHGNNNLFIFFNFLEQKLISTDKCILALKIIFALKSFC